MIKSEAREGTQQTNYPVLKRVPVNGLIVLFTGPRIGTVVSHSSSHHVIGDTSEAWAEEDFEIFNGNVKLSNCC